MGPVPFVPSSLITSVRTAPITALSSKKGPVILPMGGRKFLWSRALGRSSTVYANSGIET
jgi:hypothetical protein